MWLVVVPHEDLDRQRPEGLIRSNPVKGLDLSEIDGIKPTLWRDDSCPIAQSDESAKLVPRVNAPNVDALIILRPYLMAI
jgi:hypothetical protein